MEPKEKAKEFYDKFYFSLPFLNTNEEAINLSKKYSLILVDEVLLFLSLQQGFYDDNAVEYFKEVKEEINKL
jgi:hypothetical protein